MPLMRTLTESITLATATLVLVCAGCATAPLSDPTAVAAVEAGRRTTANAAWWGFNPTNATAAIQGAINSGARRVIIPNLGQDWIVDPIFLTNDQEVMFEKGVVITARPGGFAGLNDCLFKADKRRNLTLRGYGATLQMQKAEYTKGEWRMCLDLESCRNVKVLGLTLRNSGGDGIYLGNSDPKQPYCQDIVIRDCVMDNNRRQGLSVISAVNLLVEHCTFRGTKGTAPEAGVDLEPNLPAEKLINCVFRNCIMQDNKGAGVLIYLGSLNETSDPLSVRFEHCRVQSSLGSGIALGSTQASAPRGSIEFQRCEIEHCQGPGFALFAKSKDAARVFFDRCLWRDVARQTQSTSPLLLSGSNGNKDLTIGNLEFHHCIVEDDHDRPVLAVDTNAPPRGVAGLRGSITVHNPHGARLSLGAMTSRITLELRTGRPRMN